MKNINWQIEELPNAKTSHGLAADLNISLPLAKLLVQRGIEDYDSAHAFFRPQNDLLYNPFDMANMDESVERLARAIENRERILVYGDYDVDGTSAVALLYDYLSSMDANADYYIPDRYAEGYGVSDAGVDFAIDTKVDLLITLDCGIKAVDKLGRAVDGGLDVIVCDHHLPGEALPNGLILNPKQAHCTYPFKELTGCGIGFKLVCAHILYRGGDIQAAEKYLDLVALSIGADIVPIVDENRTLAALGLDEIRKGRSRMGISQILENNDAKKSCTISDLVFKVAPRINAAGRINSGKKAVELLLAKDEKTLGELLDTINQYNDERKEIEQTICEQALDMLANDPDQDSRVSNVLYHPEWHKGVVGIVASRVIEHYYKPTVILTDSGEVVGGSVRSVKGFDVYEAMEACAEHMNQFGGHKYAAGLTIEKDHIDAFRQAFDAAVKERILPEQLVPSIKISLEIDFRDIQGNSMDAIPKFYRILEQFSPFGPGNMRPVFVSRHLEAMYVREVGEGHLQFTAFCRNHPEIKYRCIAFNMKDKLPLLDKPFDLAYSIEKNEWQGRSNLQLHIKDIKPAL